MRQATAAVLTTWLVVAGVAMSTVCSGWQPSASARRDCCASSQHECDSQMAADACCGQTEQGSQPRVHCAVFNVAAPPLAVGIPTLALPDLQWRSRHAAAVTFERAVQQRPHSPPAFLASVLLI